MYSSHIQNDVECFGNGPVYELYSLKASQICKVHTTCELKLRNNWQNGDSLINNYDAETNTSLAEKSRMFVNTTSKAALTTANWIRILTEAT